MQISEEEKIELDKRLESYERNPDEGMLWETFKKNLLQRKQKYMAQTKKRPNKAAKAAQKVLEDSKLLANNKANTESKADQTFKPTDSPVKINTTANKNRPDKKRG